MSDVGIFFAVMEFSRFSVADLMDVTLFLSWLVFVVNDKRMSMYGVFFSLALS